MNMLLSSTSTESDTSHRSQSVTAQSDNNYVSLRDVDSLNILKSLDRQCNRNMKILPGFKAMELLTCESSAENTAHESDRSNAKYSKPTLKGLRNLNEPSLAPLLRAFREEVPSDSTYLSHQYKVEKTVYQEESDNNDSDSISLQDPHPLDEPRIAQPLPRRPSLDSMRALPSLHREDFLHDRNLLKSNSIRKSGKRRNDS